MTTYRWIFKINNRLEILKQTVLRGARRSKENMYDTRKGISAYLVCIIVEALLQPPHPFIVLNSLEGISLFPLLFAGAALTSIRLAVFAHEQYRNHAGDGKGGATNPSGPESEQEKHI